MGNHDEEPTLNTDSRGTARSECAKFGKLFGGCQFEARYDKSEPKVGIAVEYKGLAGGEFLERFRQVTYVRDVCVRCGKAIERARATGVQHE